MSIDARTAFRIDTEILKAFQVLPVVVALIAHIVVLATIINYGNFLFF